jgi:hypothetical protein
VSLALGTWWPFELAALMTGVGLALDAALYDRVLPYQAGWFALPLGALELGLVMGLAHLLRIDAPLAGAVALFVGVWVFTQLVGHAALPLLRLSYAQDGGELGRAGLALAVAVVALFASAGGISLAEGAPSPQTPMFEDVTASSNVMATLPPASCGRWAAGAAWGDVNGDGYPDLFLPRPGGRSRLWVSDGSGVFQNQAASWGVADVGPSPAGASFADYDNDGRADLYVFGDHGNRLFHRKGRRFVDVTARAGIRDGENSTSAAWGDYDGDGRLDLYVTDYGHCGPFGLRSFNPDRDRLYHNLGKGRFRDVTALLEHGGSSTIGAGFQAAWLDYNGDGRPDLYLANDKLGEKPDGNRLWRNDGPDRNGRWQFTDVSVSSRTNFKMNTMGIAVGDYNRDLRLDFALSNMTPNRLLENRGDGTFRDVAERAGVAESMSSEMMGHEMADMSMMSMSQMGTTWGAGLYDFNLDGWQDLYFAAGPVDNLQPMPNELFVSTRNGRFRDVSEESGAADPSASRGVAFGDYDRDGRVDMYVVNQGGIPRLLRNVTDYDGNHWLEVRLAGTKSNRDACGASATATVGRARLLRVVSCGSTSLASFDDLVLHFGLGGVDRVAALEIRWPSGTRQVLRDLAVDRLLTVTEPRARLGGRSRGAPASARGE